MRWSYTVNVLTFVHKRRAASAQSAEDVFAKLTEWTRGFETVRESATAGSQDEVLTTFEWNMVCLRFVDSLLSLACTNAYSQTRLITGFETRIEGVAAIVSAVKVAESAASRPLWMVVFLHQKPNMDTYTPRIQASRERLRTYYGRESIGSRRSNVSKSSAYDPQEDIATIIQCVRASLERGDFCDVH